MEGLDKQMKKPKAKEQETQKENLIGRSEREWQGGNERDMSNEVNFRRYF